jgi:hypothetical protein
MQELRRSDRLLMRSHYDRNENFIWDRITVHRADGTVSAVWTDEDEDGMFDSCEERRENGTTATWTDTDRDGTVDECRVTDREGRLLQTLVWQRDTGYVPKKP